MDLKTIIFLFAIFNFHLTVFGQFRDSLSLRIDYQHCGNNENSGIYLYKYMIVQKGMAHPERPVNPFNYGSLKVEMYDSLSNKVLYSQSYSSYFHEWQSTDEASQLQRCFVESVQVPFPERTVNIQILERDRNNQFNKKLSIFYNPGEIFTYPLSSGYEVKELLKSGDPSNKVDFVFLPEGYTKNEMKKFEEDSKRFMGYLFSWEPYSKYKDAFNIYSVFVPSDESGTDKPREGIWKNTILNSHFSTFYSERYLTIQDVDLVYDLISGVPCDHVVVIVNTDKYGGSGVYNFYTLVAADNKLSETVFLHELGHGFAGLADEYEFDNSYNEFYNFKVEPPEPNLTTLVDFDSKWKSMVEPDIPVPTPDSAKYRNKLGVFEGGGYVAKGIYRPAYDCSMKTNLKNGFCPVCTKAIEDMIRFYTGENKRKQ